MDDLTGVVFEADKPSNRPGVLPGIYIALNYVNNTQWRCFIVRADSRFAEREGQLTVVNESWLLFTCTRLS